MSGFGLLILIFFLLLTGGLVMLYWNRNEDIGLARSLMLVLVILTVTEVFMAVAEFPLRAIDGIVFVSLGSETLAYVMFFVCALVVGFVLAMILPRIKWKKALTPTPAKLIVVGAVLLCGMVYTELFNGQYSFDSAAEFSDARIMYSKYDTHFFPTKYIKKETDKGLLFSVYPFDAKSAAGKLDFIYRGEILIMKESNGKLHMYFYPFTYKVYEGVDPVDFNDKNYTKDLPDISESDVPADADTVSDSQNDGQAQ